MKDIYKELCLRRATILFQKLITRKETMNETKLKTAGWNLDNVQRLHYLGRFVIMCSASAFGFSITYYSDGVTLILITLGNKKTYRQIQSLSPNLSLG